MSASEAMESSSSSSSPSTWSAATALPPAEFQRINLRSARIWSAARPTCVGGGSRLSSRGSRWRWLSLLSWCHGGRGIFAEQGGRGTIRSGVTDIVCCGEMEGSAGSRARRRHRRILRPRHGIPCLHRQIPYAREGSRSTSRGGRSVGSGGRRPGGRGKGGAAPSG